MREFTVIFRSVQELSEFMALANQQPFDVLFVRAGGVSNAKSMFSCLSLQLNSPQMTDVIGPAECPVSKISMNYRFQIILRGLNISVMQQAANRLLTDYSHPQSVYIECDIDPVSLM